jgi:CheY-like chemotaxis protein
MHDDDESPAIQAKLLLVDDQPMNLAALKAVLEPLGHELVTASSGREALKHLLHDEFALILMDVQMPEMDGFETSRLIKEREKSRHVPILFLTAIGDDQQYAQQAYSVGAVDFIPKPFNAYVLSSKVTVFVDLYKHRIRNALQAELLRESQRRETELRQTLREQALIQAHAREVEEMARKQRRFLKEMLSSLTEGRLRLCDTRNELPAPLPPYSDPIPLSRPTLRQIRHQAADFAQQAGWSPDRLNDFITALGEATMNAVVHGRNGMGRIHADPATGTIQVWVRDEGGGIAEESLHRATLEKGFTTAGTLGHGFFMMLRTADRIWLLTGKTGTTVVLEHDRTPPAPAWLQDYAPGLSLPAADMPGGTIGQPVMAG